MWFNTTLGVYNSKSVFLAIQYHPALILTPVFKFMACFKISFMEKLMATIGIARR